MPHRLLLPLLAVLVLACDPGSVAELEERLEPDAEHAERLTSPLLRRAARARFDDLPGILERGSLTVAVTPSRSNFFFAQNRLRGFEYELLDEYGKSLRRRNRKAGRRFRMLFLPLPFDEVLDALRDGRADVAAAGLTVTPEREATVAFTEPYLTGVDEVVVTGSDVGLDSLAALAGETVYVHRGTSYVPHLEATVPGAVVKEAPEHLTVEDLLELVNAGVIPFTVADRHLAELWSAVFPDIVVRDDLVVHAGGRIAWAVRQDSPKLRADLSAFARRRSRGTLVGNVLFQRYFRDVRWVKGPAPGETARLLELEGLFRQYGSRYGFDWLKLAALAFQESRFQHDARSRAGAVGIMQVLPSTAQAMGVEDFRSLEGNIHAGTRYLDWLRRNYFDDPGVPDAAQVDFALAAYNAGPNRLRRLRRAAAERGYDPNRWFGHVEQLALEEVGWEPVSYVAGINKYYFAFSLQYELQQRKQRTRRKLLGG